VPTGIPHGWDEELLEQGAPDGLAYKAAQELTLLDDPGSGPLVCFGISGIYGRLCLDPRTKQIVHVSYGAFRRSGPQPKVIGVTLRAILHHEMAAKLHHSITANVHRLDGCFNELSVWADKAVGW
jgi:hypothetical protein